MPAIDPAAETAGEEIHDVVRSAAHDLNNLRYRLTLLTDAVQNGLTEPAARADAREMLADTTRVLGEIVNRLRSAARGARRDLTGE